MIRVIGPLTGSEDFSFEEEILLKKKKKDDNNTNDSITRLLEIFVLNPIFQVIIEKDWESCVYSLASVNKIFYFIFYRFFFCLTN